MVANMLGEIVLVLEGNRDQIDIQDLPAGMYTLIVMGRNAVVTKTFIVDRVGN